MRLEAPAGKEDASHQPSGLSPKTMWEAEAHPKQGLCPSQQLTYSSWVETPCPLVFHLENSPEMIQPPCQTEEAALGGEQLLLFALHGNLFFFSQNSSLPWVDEDTVAIYSEIMSGMHYQRSCGLFCTWDFHVSQNRKRFNFFPITRTTIYLLRVPCATKSELNILYFCLSWLLKRLCPRHVILLLKVGQQARKNRG